VPCINAKYLWYKILLLLHHGNGEEIAMCGRFEQSGTRRYYAKALGADTSDHVKWLGDNIPSSIPPGEVPMDDHGSQWAVAIHRYDLGLSNP
jgi:hypothetical protein